MHKDSFTDHAGAVAHVINWISENIRRLGLQEMERTHLAGRLAAQYETPRHLISIRVWDHAYCLDILVFDQSTCEQVFSEAGPCDSIHGLQQRLDIFVNWMLRQLNDGSAYFLPARQSTP